MRFVPTVIHGVADYLVAAIFVFLAYYMDLRGPVFWVPIGLAATALLYSLLTDYEFGLLKLLSVRSHLLLDAAFGLATIMYSAAIGATSRHELSLLIFGILSIILAATTKLSPSASPSS